MTIPDLIFTVGGIIHAVVLFPACRNPETRIPLRTSLPTGLVLFVYAWTFAFMDLPFSALSSSVTSAMWAFIVSERRTGQ